MISEHPIQDQSQNEVSAKDLHAKTEELNPKQTDQSSLFDTLLSQISTEKLQNKFNETKPNTFEMDIHSEDIEPDDSAPKTESKAKERSQKSQSKKENRQHSFSKDITDTIHISQQQQSNLMPLQFIYQFIQKTLSELQSSQKPLPAHQSYLFTTDIHDKERLDIAIRKQAGKFKIKLYADPDLQKFISDKVGALIAHLKKKEIECDEIEVLALEEMEAPLTQESQPPKQRVTLK